MPRLWAYLLHYMCLIHTYVLNTCSANSKGVCKNHAKLPTSGIFGGKIFRWLNFHLVYFLLMMTRQYKLTPFICWRKYFAISIFMTLSTCRKNSFCFVHISKQRYTRATCSYCDIVWIELISCASRPLLLR